MSTTYSVAMKLLIMLLALLASRSGDVFGATLVNPRHRLRYKVTDRRRSTVDSIRSVLDFNKGVNLEPQIEQKTCQGNRIIKLKETIDGRAVYNATVTITVDNYRRGVDASGAFYEDIDMDELMENIQISKKQVLQIAMGLNNDLEEHIHRVSVKLQVYIDTQQDTYLAYFVNYISVTGGKPKRPLTIVDSVSGDILLSLDILDRCKSPVKAHGGNTKIGRIDYGEASKCLNLQMEGNYCKLENEYVRVIDMNSTMNDNLTRSAKFLCDESYGDSVNGAYSPATDALFYGTAVVRMFHDWYNIKPLDDDILMRVHYGKNYTDAFWDGLYCSFGDGTADGLYPLVALDVVGHEIGHGITEQFSDLLYVGESGAINEAFSDMTGEAAEEYIGKADWMVGYSIVRNGTAIRYFHNSTSDKGSIDHIRYYREGMDSHISGGIYRRVFYILVHRYGISIRKAYEVFLFANQMYWHKMTTFIGGACDVLRAALDLGSPVYVYARAFEAVGIKTCDVHEHIFWLRDAEMYRGIYVAAETHPIFGFSVPTWAKDIVIKTMAAAPINITLYHAGSLVNDDYYIVAYGRNRLRYSLLPIGNRNDYYIQLSSPTYYVVQNVRMVAKYTCLYNFTSDNSDMLKNFEKDCPL